VGVSRPGALEHPSVRNHMLIGSSGRSLRNKRKNEKNCTKKKHVKKKKSAQHVKKTEPEFLNKRKKPNCKKTKETKNSFNWESEPRV